MSNVNTQKENLLKLIQEYKKYKYQSEEYGKETICDSDMHGDITLELKLKMLSDQIHEEFYNLIQVLSNV